MSLVSAEPRSEPAVAQARGRYLYAIVDGGNDLESFGCAGMEGADVYALGDDQIAAVVSDLPDRRIRPERRRLAAHHEVLRRLMIDHTVLPMAFGLIADGPESVCRILRLNRDVFDEQLRRLRGKLEMGLRVTWDVANIFEYTVGVHPELTAYRDQIFRGGRAPSQDEKIELGRFFDRLLNADRQACTDGVMRVLGPRCAEIVVNKPRDEREVMNLACLIDRDRLKDYESAVVEAARGFNNDFAFDFNGPWPPHNFVEVDLRLS
ncbi:MAG TPA: GvpL/GvpF family gas vesicle protein [Isosphaeraceae bacterium]|nr:GvpL/GvpF family gas vesicle protein [Isosphaeraceae bacterium]